MSFEKSRRAKASKPGKADCTTPRETPDRLGRLLSERIRGLAVDQLDLSQPDSLDLLTIIRNFLFNRFNFLIKTIIGL